uniref:Uncharacterized protein n=1 Tax=Arundo donax TaxID=35708 RepID=A0A0A9C4F1_ARUDO
MSPSLIGESSPAYASGAAVEENAVEL